MNFNLFWTSCMMVSLSRLCSARSHLFITTITPLNESSIYPAICVSWLVTNSETSVTRIHTSELPIFLIDLNTLYFSIPASIRPLLRTPAVSTNVMFVSSYEKLTSIASRVVPGVSETIDLSSPTILFTSIDLPTLGRPTIANLICPSTSSASIGSPSISSSLLRRSLIPRL